MDFNMAIWNIRGLSTSDKQKEVRNIIKEENLQLCGIIETHIKYHNILQIGHKVFENWDFTSNGEDNNKDCRIIVGWNPNKLRVWVIAKTKQWEEHSNGSLVLSNEINEFAEFIREIEVEDILSSGFHFTWTKSRGNPQCRTLKKLDRILISEAFIDKLHAANGMFLPYMISDHSPAKKVGTLCKFMAFGWDMWCEKKMKLKEPLLNKLSWKNRNIFERVTKLRECLKEVQAEVDKHPHNEDIKAKSCKVLNEYYDAMKDEINLLMQKAKIEWLKDGERFENDKVAEQFVKHFQGFLGKKDVVTNMPTDRIVFPNKLSSEEADKMCRDVSVVEVKNAMFDIEDSKAPGPDGYTARFYKSAWSVISKDICKVVQDFFVNGKLLGEVNATLISLVPKVQNPDRVSEFRPIACCNVIYKCISKIITNRLKGVLGRLVHESQSAFIDGRQITDNILLAQELFKVVLEQFGFPNMMVEWIMVCVSTTKFSININGEREGYFSGERGLRQGDPMSPYLFTLVMEAFNIIMRKNISENKEFNEQLFWFESQYEQKYCLFGGLTNAEQNIILGIVPFAIGRLLVRYLRVPLITKKINASDCKPLVEKVKNKVLDWRNKALTYFGRLQLIPYVLSAMQIYWASIFLLLKNVIYEINKLLKGFLWCQGELTKGKAKVSWEKVYKPKEQGGLGIKNLQVWNEVLLAKQLWSVIAKKDTLWKVGDGHSVNAWYDNWCCAGPLCAIVTSREIYEAGLSINTTIADLVTKAGDKDMLPCTVNNLCVRSPHIFATSYVHFWSEYYCGDIGLLTWEGPLCAIVTSREIYEAGLSINTTIADLVTKYEGNWPEG
ncbi:RNA-directed DNA polymerase, eukaryota, reverse transcriptase zinc-binding domain protein [Tanacetum coccineum]